MTILRTRETWRRPYAPRVIESSNRLPPDQQENVRAAMHAMRLRCHGWDALAVAMRVSAKTLRNMSARRGRPTAGMAIRIARLAGVSAGDVLSGVFRRPGACLACGRHG